MARVKKSLATIVIDKCDNNEYRKRMISNRETLRIHGCQVG